EAGFVAPRSEGLYLLRLCRRRALPAIARPAGRPAARDACDREPAFRERAVASSDRGARGGACPHARDARRRCARLRSDLYGECQRRAARGCGVLPIWFRLAVRAD